MTREEHVKLYNEHRVKATRLYLKLVSLSGLAAMCSNADMQEDLSAGLAKDATEYHEELAAMCCHYSKAVEMP